MQTDDKETAEVLQYVYNILGAFVLHSWLKWQIENWLHKIILHEIWVPKDTSELGLQK